MELELVNAPTRTKREIIEGLFDVEPTQDPASVAGRVGCSLAYAGHVWALKALRAKHANDPKPTLGASALHTLRAETERRLDLLKERVAEGKQVDEASEFARWLVASGVLKVCGDHAINKKQSDLLYACADSWNGKSVPMSAKSVQSICERLSSIEAKLSK